MTALLMSIAYVTIAILPTYAQIGVTASWVVTICRIIQGMSSMGEIVGAELYLTEKLNPPIQYPAVALISIFASVGSAVALGIACLVTSFDFNWRIAFWFGAGIAFVGSLEQDSEKYQNLLMQNSNYKKL